MRVALLADVHANLPALQACLADGRAAGADAWVCAGDLVGWGPQPEECVALLREVGAACVAGNHDLAATGQLASPRGTPAALESMRRTREALSAATLQQLAALPLTTTTEGLVVAHGSPDDPEEYVRSEGRADVLLDAVAGGGILVLGHTHEPWVHARRSGTLLRKKPGQVRLPADQAVLINPGSVGQSRVRSPHARYAVLDLDERTVDLREVRYDLEASRRALRDAGLPKGTLHTPLRLRLRARTRARARAVKRALRQRTR